MILIGEIAGLLTSLFFAINAVVVTKATRTVGSSVIANRTRVAFALLYLIVINFVLYHQPLPLQAGTGRWTWLSISGVIGLALGDAFLFQAYIMVGARLGTLLLSLSTIFGALEAWIFFGESLSLMEIIGIALTLGGIVWVILEHGNNKSQTISSVRIGDSVRSPRRHRSSHRIGSFQTRHVGKFLAHQRKRDPHVGGGDRVMADHVHATRSGKDHSNSKENPSGLRLLALAALIGPVIGVSLSLLAVQNTAVGVASVLTSLAPIFMLPIGHFYFKERLGWQAIAGTILAMIGVAIFWLKRFHHRDTEFTKKNFVKENLCVLRDFVVN